MFTRLLARARFGLQDLLPSTCWVCHRFGPDAVCQECIGQFAQPRVRCTTCAAPLVGAPSTHPEAASRCGKCLSLGSALDACHAVVDYAYPWQLVLQRLKYADSGDLSAQPSVALAFAQIARAVMQLDPALKAALQAAQSGWVIPVPLHPQRQRERGFNQANMLAQALFPGHPGIRSDLLLRVKNTSVQARLSRDRRAHNMRHAFMVAVDQVALANGASVTLIDDVATTTSTLSAAAEALRQAGAKDIRAIVMARAA